MYQPTLLFPFGYDIIELRNQYSKLILLCAGNPKLNNKLKRSAVF